MVRHTNRETFETEAKEDPYASMSDRAIGFLVHDMEWGIIDAATGKTDLSADMNFQESYIGAGLMSVTDYGRHRDSNQTYQDIINHVRAELREGFPSQYLKVMDDDKSRIADMLVVVTKRNGYAVYPHFDE